MVRRYNDYNWRELLREPVTENGLPEALPRRTRYGSIEAGRLGLIPVQDYPDMLIDPKDYKEVIQHCHDQKIFPLYHQDNTKLFNGSNQSNLPYCWAWSATNSLMGCRAAEGQEPVLLAPVSLGWLVSWSSQGYFLDATIQGMRDRGVAPASYIPDQHSRNPKQYKAGWEAEALKYRAAEWWDCNYVSEKAMLQQCLSILATGRPLYSAWNHLGHAMEIVGLRWDDAARNSIVLVIRNSWGEQDHIEMEGARAIPNEAFGLRACMVV